MANSGMSPRKQMAGGDSTGDFGVGPMTRSMGTHPDETAGVGRRGPMADSERAATGGINHTRDYHPAQAAPDHGPHHPGGYGMKR